MRRFKFFLVVVTAALAVSCFAQQSLTPAFPTNTQIQLVITQAERAVANYDSAIELEGTEFGAAAGSAKDREVSVEVKKIIAALKKQPERFNSPVGFLLIIQLDDASRNMAVCMSQGANAAMGLALNRDLTGANTKMDVGRTCLDSSQLLYAISDSAAQLYENYLIANATLEDEAVDTVTKCSKILKEHTKTK